MAKVLFLKLYNRMKYFSGMEVPCLYIRDVHKSL